MSTKLHAGERQNGCRFWRALLFVLALFGLAINLLLLVRRLSDETATLAGCGAGSGCETVLGSRWSEVLGMPVTVPGLLVYAALLLAITHAGRALLAPLLGLIFGAAVWFIVVQAVLIQAYCPWCMAAHATGVTLAALGLPFAARTAGPWRRVAAKFGIAAVVGIAGIALFQVFGPRPASHRVSEIAPPGEAATQVMEDAHSAGDGRLAVFFDGRKGYRVEDLPHLGRPDATHVLVEYFDYACSACHTMSGYLAALVAAHPDDVCVVLLPVPLDRGCNPHMGPLDTSHPGACDLARAALAVWHRAPDQFPPFHQAIFADSTADNARMLAGGLIPDAPATMRGEWVESILNANFDDWQVISADNPKLPKLVIGNRRILHGFPATEAEFIRVIATELGIE